eukprot:113898-Prymnesium_polylepis.1
MAVAPDRCRRALSAAQAPMRAAQRTPSLQSQRLVYAMPAPDDDASEPASEPGATAHTALAS